MLQPRHEYNTWIGMTVTFIGGKEMVGEMKHFTTLDQVDAILQRL